MRLVSYNIQYGRGKDGRFDLDRIAAEVAGADVIAMQEVERYWVRSGLVDQPAELARRLADYYWVYGAGVDVHAPAAVAGERAGACRRQFGNLLMARTPILATRNHLLPKRSSIGPMSLQRAALEGVIETAVGMLRVYSLHLTHLSAETRLPQVEMLLRVHRDAPWEGAAFAAGDPQAEWVRESAPPAPGSYAVLMGDFNAEPDSSEYARIVGPLSDYGGRIINPQGFVDAWVQAGHAERAGVTADIHGRPVRLDYCFVSAALRDRVRGARIDEEARGSDHQPLWVDIDL